MKDKRRKKESSDLELCLACVCLCEDESGVMEGVVMLLESVKEDSECTVTCSSLSTFSADSVHVYLKCTLCNAFVC